MERMTGTCLTILCSGNNPLTSYSVSSSAARGSIRVIKARKSGAVLRYQLRVRSVMVYYQAALRRHLVIQIPDCSVGVRRVLDHSKT